MARYEIRVSVRPQLHEDEMAHLWQIVQVNSDGVFTVQHGWADDFTMAMLDVEAAVYDLELVS